MPYPGGKEGEGVYQTIINLMPPHSTYIEPFLGGGAVMRMKRPAAVNIGLDMDWDVIHQIRRWRPPSSETAIVPVQTSTIVKNSDTESTIAISSVARSSLVTPGDTRDREPRFEFLFRDAIPFLKSYPFTGDELVYCDPPYMHETRKKLKLYKFEMTDKQHETLLETILKLPCMVMISGYYTPLYAEKLAQWQVRTFQTTNRAGQLTKEWLWFNYPEPVALHDYRYLGTGFRERERIKRKTARWRGKLARMPVLERRALLAAMDVLKGREDERA